MESDRALVRSGRLGGKETERAGSRRSGAGPDGGHRHTPGGTRDLRVRLCAFVRARLCAFVRARLCAFACDGGHRHTPVVLGTCACVCVRLCVFVSLCARLCVRVCVRLRARAREYRARVGL